jgi:hypothetical protein
MFLEWIIRKSCQPEFCKLSGYYFLDAMAWSIVSKTDTYKIEFISSLISLAATESEKLTVVTEGNDEQLSNGKDNPPQDGLILFSK